SFSHCYGHAPDLRAFPTRRSSDLSRRRDKRRHSSIQLRCSNAFIVTSQRRCILTWRTTTRSAATVTSSWPAPMKRTKRPMKSCRSEEHTSELQSLRHLVCRLLLEK